MLQGKKRRERYVRRRRKGMNGEKEEENKGRRKEGTKE